MEMRFQECHLRGRQDLLLSNRLSQLIQYQLSPLMGRGDQERSGQS